MLPPIKEYLDVVRSHLHLDPETELRAVRELHSYFEEKVKELQDSGLSEKAAAKTAIEHCGRAKGIARRMYEAHSKGSWVEAAMAFLPHFAFAILFFFHLWQSTLLGPTFLFLIIYVSLYE